MPFPSFNSQLRESINHEFKYSPIFSASVL